MLDLRGALAKGVASAEEAARNQLEIDAVLQEVDAEVMAFTGRKVKMMSNRVSGLFNIARETIGVDFSASEYEFLDKLYLASLENDDKNALFARLLRSERGYPCILMSGLDSQTCLDRNSLLTAFSNVLSTHDTGNIVYGLMNYNASNDPNIELDDN